MDVDKNDIDVDIVDHFFSLITKEKIAEKFEASKITTNALFPTVDTSSNFQIVVENNGTGVICSDARAQTVLRNAVVGSFIVPDFFKFGVANIIHISLYSRLDKTELGYFYLIFKSLSFDDSKGNQILKKKADRMLESKEIYIHKYEKNVSKNGGIGELVKDGFKSLGSSISLTTELIRKYNINICQLVTSGISLLDLKNSGLISTFDYLIKNLDFRPSDLLINKRLLNLSHLRSLYNITFADLSSKFLLTPEDYLIDYHFSIGELVTIDLDIVSLFPSLFLIGNDDVSLNRSWLTLKDSMVLFYRWYLTVNGSKMDHMYNKLPKTNKKNQFDTIKLPESISEFTTEEKSENNVNIIEYINKNFQINIGANKESNNDGFDTWCTMYSLKMIYMKSLFPNVDDLIKTIIMATDFDKSLQNSVDSLNTIYNNVFEILGIPKFDDKLDTYKPFLGTRIFSNFMIVVDFSIIITNIHEFIKLKNDMSASKRRVDQIYLDKETENVVNSFRKHAKKLEFKSGIRLLRSQEMESKNTSVFGIGHSKSDLDNVNTISIDNMIDNELVGTIQIPLQTSKILNYIYFNLLCGNILDYDKMKRSDVFPVKVISSKKMGLVTSSFDNEEFTKKTYTNFKNERRDMKLCSKFHHHKNVCYLNHVYLIDSIALYFLLKYIENTELKLNNVIKSKLNSTKNDIDQNKKIQFFKLSILGIVPVKNFVYGTKKFWASRNSKEEKSNETSTTNSKRKKGNQTSTNKSGSNNKKTSHEDMFYENDDGYDSGDNNTNI